MVWPPLEGWGAACFLGTTRRLPRFQQRTSNPKHHERQWKDLEGQVNDSSRLYMMLLLSNTIPQNHPVLLLYMYTPLPRGKLASPSHTTSDLTSVPRDPQLWLGLFDQPLPGPQAMEVDPAAPRRPQLEGVRQAPEDIVSCDGFSNATMAGKMLASPSAA